MFRICFLLILNSTLLSCSSQNEQINTKKAPVGGPCEGCEAIYEYNNKELSSIDTMPLFNESTEKLLISGTIYQLDGITPAKDVIVYIYHTDSTGVYPKNGDETGWGQRHGYNRGWVKTGEDGKYAFYTARPKSYPNSNQPAHIHITVKEPDYNEYYLDEYAFKDDPFLNEEYINKMSQRGGMGVVKTKIKDEMMYAERDLILGKNIEGY